MAVGMVNKFRDNFKTILESGFTKNGQQFFGTADGEIFTVLNYEAVEKPFKVLTTFPTTTEFSIRPWIAISRPGIDSVNMVGGNVKYKLNVIMDIAFAKEYKKVVSGTTLSGEDLAVWLEEQIRKSLQVMVTEFTDVKVQNIDKVASIPQQLDVNDTIVYGSRIQFECEVRLI